MMFTKTILSLTTTACLLACVLSKSYSTDDALIFEDDPFQLPGPSIFEYRNSFTSWSPPGKVKRGNSKKGKKKEENEAPRYYEVAGDELYVFEPSPLGVEPFMEALVEEYQPAHIALNFQKGGKKGSRVNPMRHYDIPMALSFNEHLRHASRHPVFEKSPGIVSRPGEIEASDTGGAIVAHSGCISANGRLGKCAPFRECYPVVFNLVSGKIRNLGLAEILYQASGSCRKQPTSGKNRIVPAILPAHIPAGFYNETVCCPTFNYYESSHEFLGYTSSESEPTPKPMKPSPADPILRPQKVLISDSANAKIKTPPAIYQSYRPLSPTLLQIPISVPLPTHSQTSHEPPVYDSQDDYYDDIYVNPFSHAGTSSKKEEEAPLLGDDLMTFFESLREHNVRNENNGGKKGDLAKQSSNSKEVQSNESKTRNLAVHSNINETISGPPSRAKKNKELHTSSTEKSVKISYSPAISEASKTGKRKVVSVSKQQKSEAREIKRPSEVNIPASPSLSAWNCPGREIGMPRGHWPWMVALLFDGSHFCSGSLIDHRHILTSATCVSLFQGKEIRKIRAVLGDRILYSNQDGPHVWRKITRITRHLHYNQNRLKNDIALLEMDSSVSFTSNIQPINVPVTEDRPEDASKAIVSGWSGADIGKRFFLPRPSHDAIVDFLDVDQCLNKYAGFVPPNVSRDIICGKPSNDTCQADLGAPLMLKTGNCWHIIGILTGGLGCGMFPEIFTSTAKHHTWIQKNIRRHLPS